MKKLNIKMIKNNYFKYTLIIITFSLIFFLSSCNKEQEKKKDEMLSIFNQIEQLDQKINDADFYKTSFYCNINDTLEGNLNYENNECIVKKDLSYISKKTISKDNEKKYDYYSCKDNQYYHLSPLEDKEYDMTKIDDFDLNNIIGFDNPLPSKEIVNDIKKITIIDDDYRIPYSLVKNNSLIKKVFDYGYFNDLNDYLSDDELLVHFSFVCYKSQYSVSCSFWYVKDSSSIKTEIVLTKDILNNTDKLNVEFNQQNIDLIFNEEKYINLLPKGEEVLNFTPKYSGYYDININLSNPVNVTIGDEEYSGSNLKITKLLNSNEKYLINIENQDKYSEGSIKIIYSDKVNMDNISIRGNDEFVIKLDKIEGFKNILTNNDDVLIEDFFYDNNYFYSQSDSFKPTSKCSYYFKEKEYFILLKNNSSEEQEVTLETKEIDSLTEGINPNKELYMNDTYFKIENLNGGQYLVLSDKTKVYGFCVFNSKFELLCYPPFYGNGECLISVDGGKTYYLGLTNDNYSITSISITREEISYEWEIKGDDGFYLRTYESDISLKRGHNYHLNFLVNGHIQETKMDYMVYNDDYCENDFEFKNNVLKINENSSFDYEIIISSLYEYVFLVYPHNLVIRTIFDIDEIKISLNNDDKLELKYSLPSYIKSFDYSLRVGENEIKCKSNTNPSIQEEFVDEIDLSTIKSELGAGDLIITIYKINYVDAYNREKDISCNILIKENNL